MDPVETAARAICGVLNAVLFSDEARRDAYVDQQWPAYRVAAEAVLQALTVTDAVGQKAAADAAARDTLLTVRDMLAKEPLLGVVEWLQARLQ